MEENNEELIEEKAPEKKENSNLKTALIHGGLFLATLITTTIAGAEWQHGKALIVTGLTWSEFFSGFMFSIPFLLIFSFHEFGHYFTARSYNIKTSLPYYIPLPPIPSLIGTLGAVIRLKERVKSTTQNFDIGIAGPLAGFVIAILVLTYGYTNLPEKEYVFSVHPEYQYFGDKYDQYVYGYDTTVTKEMVKDIVSEEYYATLADTVISPLYGPYLKVNKSLMISFFEKYVVPSQDKDKIPNDYELAHYPVLFAGFLALFFTALNLLPIGQLDGGHVTYGLFGKKGHSIIAVTLYILFLFYAGLGLITLYMPAEDLLIYAPLYVYFLYVCLKSLGVSNRDRLMYAMAIFTVQFLIGWQYPTIEGYSGWLLFAFLIGRVIGVHHPMSVREEKLSSGRIALGWISLFILITCFSPTPLSI